MSRYTAEEILELAVRVMYSSGDGAQLTFSAMCRMLSVFASVRQWPIVSACSCSGSGLPISLATARREIERNDAAHNGTMQRLFGIDWTDPALYASVLNTARIPIADCVEHIVNVAGSPAFQETAQSRMALSDQLILSKVHSALDRRFGSSATALGLDAEVEAGKVVLRGRSSDQRLIAETVRLMHSISGIQAVESRIAHIAFVRDPN